MKQPHGSEEPGDFRLTQLDADALKERQPELAKLGWDPLDASQHHVQTSSEHEVGKLESKYLKPEKHSAVFVLEKGGRIEALVTLRTPKGEREAVIEHIMLMGSGRQKETMEQLFRSLKESLKSLEGGPYTRAVIALGAEQEARKDLKDALESPLLDRFYTFRKEEPHAQEERRAA